MKDRFRAAPRVAVARSRVVGRGAALEGTVIKRHLVTEVIPEKTN